MSVRERPGRTCWSTCTCTERAEPRAQPCKASGWLPAPRCLSWPVPMVMCMCSHSPASSCSGRPRPYDHPPPRPHLQTRREFQELPLIGGGGGGVWDTLLYGVQLFRICYKIYWGVLQIYFVPGLRIHSCSPGPIPSPFSSLDQECSLKCM